MMSQNEMMVAMQYYEEPESTISQRMISLGKASSGNLVEEFFSQTYTR